MSEQIEQSRRRRRYNPRYIKRIRSAALSVVPDSEGPIVSEKQLRVEILATAATSAGNGLASSGH